MRARPSALRLISRTNSARGGLVCWCTFCAAQLCTCWLSWGLLTRPCHELLFSPLCVSAAASALRRCSATLLIAAADLSSRSSAIHTASAAWATIAPCDTFLYFFRSHPPPVGPTPPSFRWAPFISTMAGFELRTHTHTVTDFCGLGSTVGALLPYIKNE